MDQGGGRRQDPESVSRSPKPAAQPRAIVAVRAATRRAWCHPYSRCSNSRIFVPAARSHARGLSIFHPARGWRSADRRPGATAPGGPPRHTRNDRIDANALVSRGGPGRLRGAPRPSAEGTRASRRSTVAILGSGPRFHLRHFLRIRAASSSQPGRSAWRAGSPSLPRRAVTSRKPRNGHSPLRLQDRLRRTPLMSEVDAIRSYVLRRTQVTTS